MLLVSSTFKCKILPAQITLLPSGVTCNINSTAAGEFDRSSSLTRSALLRPEEGWRGWGSCRTQSILEVAETALHINSFPAWPHSRLTQTDLEKKLYYHSCFWANIYSGRLSSELLKFLSLFLSYWSVIIGAIIHLCSLYSSLAHSSKFYKRHWSR